MSNTGLMSQQGPDAHDPNEQEAGKPSSPDLGTSDSSLNQSSLHGSSALHNETSDPADEPTSPYSRPEPPGQPSSVGESQAPSPQEYEQGDEQGSFPSYGPPTSGYAAPPPYDPNLNYDPNYGANPPYVPPPYDTGTPGYGSNQPYGQTTGPANPYEPNPYPVNPYQPSFGGYAPYGAVPQQHPQAVTALVLGIVGLGVCPPVGIGGFILGGRIRKAIDAEPQRYAGRGMATAAWVLGILSIVSTGLIVLLALLAIGGAASS